MDEKNISHSFTLDERSSMTLSGVLDLIDFDEGLVELTTPLGMLTVEGSEIHISALDTERHELTLNGKIVSVYYAEKKAKKNRGLFSGSSNK